MGLLTGGWQFRSFPWNAKPPTWLFIATWVLYVVVGGGIGLLSGGWLAGQFVQIF
jgi:hypothetical protein